MTPHKSGKSHRAPNFLMARQRETSPTALSKT